LTQFDPEHLKKVKKKNFEKANEFIIETGFLAFFLLMKIYNTKYEKEETIRNDFAHLQPKSLKYKRYDEVSEETIENFLMLSRSNHDPVNRANSGRIQTRS